MGKDALNEFMNDPEGKWIGRTLSSIPTSYTIFRDAIDGVYRAEANQRSGIDYPSTDLTDATTVISNVISTGKKIFLKDGIYLLKSSLVAADDLTIEGESRNGTIIRWAGSGADNIIDADVNRLTLKNLTIDGATIAGTTGIQCTALKGDWHFENVTIQNCPVIGLDGSNIFQSIFSHVFFSANGVGTKTGQAGNYFYGCIWGGGHTKAFQLAGAAINGAQFFGGIFTGSATQISLEGPTAEIGFHGVWFENSTTALLAVPNAAVIRKLTFGNCHMHTSGAMASFLNLTNMSGQLEMTNCEIPLEAPVITLGANCNFSHIDNSTSAMQNVAAQPITTYVDGGVQNQAYHEVVKNRALGNGVANYAFTIFRTMPSTAYRVLVTPSWATICSISAKAVGGFTVNFSAVTPDANQTIDVDVIY